MIATLQKRHFEHLDGTQSEMPSPVSNDVEPTRKALEESHIGTDLGGLLRQQTTSRDAHLPGFLTTADQSHARKNSWRGRFEKVIGLFAGKRTVRDEPLIPSGLIPRRRETNNPIPIVVVSSREPLLSRSAERLAFTQPEVPEAASMNDALHDKYRECLRNAKTNLHLSFAQVKQLVEQAQVPMLPLSSDAKRSKVCFLLPLNDVGKPLLFDQDKLNVGRAVEQLFAYKSRVVSRHQCQLFRDMNNVYIYDVGSHGGTFVNGERMSSAGQVSSTRKLEHMDVVQFGTDFVQKEVQSAELKAPQFVVLFGHAQPQEAKKGKRAEAVALKRGKLQTLMVRARQIPFEEASPGYFRLYLETCDFLADNTSGRAFLESPELGKFVFEFNNFQLAWAVSMMQLGQLSPAIWVMDRSKSGTYKLSHDGNCQAKMFQHDGKVFLIPKGRQCITSSKTGKPELKIVPPPAFLVCGSKSSSPVSLPSPSLSMLSLSNPEEEQQDRYYYTLTGSIKAGVKMTLKLPGHAASSVAESVMVRCDAGRRDKRYTWIDGRVILPEMLRTDCSNILLAMLLTTLSTQE